MRRKLILTIATIIISLTALIANAGNVHFVGLLETFRGSFGLSGSVAGVANDTLNYHLTASATVNALCVNNGGTAAPGRNDLTVYTSSFATGTSDSNGRDDIYLAAPDPSDLGLSLISPNKKEAGCPNGSWDVVGLTNTFWTGARFNVTDADTGELLLSVSWTCYGTPESCVMN